MDSGLENATGSLLLQARQVRQPTLIYEGIQDGICGSIYAEQDNGTTNQCHKDFFPIFLLDALVDYSGPIILHKPTRTNLFIN